MKGQNIYDFINFTDYMLETWIDDDALFPSELWNHYANTEERVNNNNEGYNHRFARYALVKYRIQGWHFIFIFPK